MPLERALVCYRNPREVQQLYFGYNFNLGIYYVGKNAGITYSVTHPKIKEKEPTHLPRRIGLLCWKDEVKKNHTLTVGAEVRNCKSFQGVHVWIMSLIKYYPLKVFLTTLG